MPYNIEIFISDYRAILTRLKVSIEGIFLNDVYITIFSPIISLFVNM